MILRFASALLAISYCLVGSYAFAAEVVFPGISRLGLVPPAGMQTATRFAGFEQGGSDAIILLNELPKEAFDEITKTLSEQALQAQGLQIVSRGKLDAIKTDNLLIVAEQKLPTTSVRRYMLVSKGDDLTGLVTVQLPGSAQKTFRDAEVRKALATYAVRAPLSAEEQLKGLPFVLTDMNGFRLVRTFAGNAVMLTDGPSDDVPNVGQPAAVVASTFMPVPDAERDAFNKRALNTLPQLKEIRIESEQSTGSGDSQVSELIGSARSASSGELTMVFQTIKYNKDGYLRLVGQGPLDDREKLVARFRKMAASLQKK